MAQATGEANIRMMILLGAHILEEKILSFFGSLAFRLSFSHYFQCKKSVSLMHSPLACSYNEMPSETSLYGFKSWLRVT